METAYVLVQCKIAHEMEVLKALLEIDLVKEATVTLRIFNISGKLVHEYKITDMQPGIYGQDTPFYWNSSGNPSGVYIYSFELSTGEVEFNKLMLIK